MLGSGLENSSVGAVRPAPFDRRTWAPLLGSEKKVTPLEQEVAAAAAIAAGT